MPNARSAPPPMLRLRRASSIHENCFSGYGPRTRVRVETPCAIANDLNSHSGVQARTTKIQFDAHSETGLPSLIGVIVL